MKIGILIASVYASPTLFPSRIFAPADLARDMVRGLTARGHTVTVFGPSDMNVNAPIIGGTLETVQHPLPYAKFTSRISKTEQSWVQKEFTKHAFELDVIARAFRALKQGEIDILHVYHDSSMFISHYIQEVFGDRMPVVYTLHDPLPREGSFEFHQLSRFADHMYVSISDSQRASELSLRFIATVYHGLSAAAFPMEDKPSTYLLFMGRLVPEKGLHTAIQVALATKTQLEIGSDISYSSNDQYYVTSIKPFIDNVLIREPGLVKDKEKVFLYSHAKALLFPIEWQEPFGMVMVEAMACGTPVVAYNCGSVPEIVKDGMTGFIVEPEDTGPAARQPHIHPQGDPGSGAPRLASPASAGSYMIQKKGVAGLVEAVQRIGEIDRTACRRHVEDHFSVERMVEGYEKVYEKVLG